jgi:hypothetical protein
VNGGAAAATRGKENIMEILELSAIGRLVLIAIAILGCSPHSVAVEVEGRRTARPCRVWTFDGLELLECEGSRRRGYAICVPPPDVAEMRGRVPSLPVGRDPWSPECGPDLVAPCELGVACSADGCSCACDHDGDCRGMVAGIEAPLPDGASVCDAGRCVWAVGP